MYLPRVSGVASWVWVRPILMMSAYSFAFASKASCSFCRPERWLFRSRFKRAWGARNDTPHQKRIFVFSCNCSDDTGSTTTTTTYLEDGDINCIIIMQYCGSRSAWIQNFFLDPELFVRIRIQPKIREQINKNLFIIFGLWILSCVWIRNKSCRIPNQNWCNDDNALTGYEGLVYLYSYGNMHGGGVGVVAALALVHMIVGVDRLLAA